MFNSTHDARSLRRRVTAVLAATALFVPVLAATPQAHAAPTPPDKELRLWYDKPAPMSQTPQSAGKTDWTWDDLDKSWEDWSLPLGNGLLGASVFGGTGTERIQITENSLRNPYTPGTTGKYNSGMNSFAETYVDFGHQDTAKDYTRDLDLKTASSQVTYTADGVDYTREYFASNPDKVLVMRFAASQKGKLNFTLKPQAPYIKDYNKVPGDGMGKTGTVTAVGDTITLGGTMAMYGIEYEGQYKVIPQGGKMKAVTKDGRGEIEVSGATSATVLLSVGTNHKVEPRVFTAPNNDKLTPYPHPHKKVTKALEAAATKGYTRLRKDHLKDYRNLFDRVRLDVGGSVPTVTTDRLRSSYGKGGSAADDAYLEELYFQYGRYLLIASSREGGLPNNLQGIWNAYDSSPWGAGMWHNINQQMNMWPAFTTNLSETFLPYADFNQEYLPAARRRADAYITGVNPAAKAPDGENGWAVGTGIDPYQVEGPNATGHSGPGTGAFTSLLFKDYADYTQDARFTEEVAYPTILEMARFLDKTLKKYDGTYLVEKSASPEQRVGTTHYRTTGTAFDQQMVHDNLVALLDYADELGYESKELDDLGAKVYKLDPVIVGKSGQVKEYREEQRYGEIGDPKHRHISQLVGLHPGTSINDSTDAWMDAARVTLNGRGDDGTGWAKAHKINLWARTGDGDRAHKLLQGLLKTSTLPNLWDTHPPFQIDGNLGGTNGVAEMLLQSGSGELRPLAALPSTWKTGSYTGLTARGGFTVDAAWENGEATSFTVGSKVGGEAAVKYPGIAVGSGSAGVKVTQANNGKALPITRDGRDVIKFATKAGQKYLIEQIPVENEPADPTDLKVARDGADGFTVRWAAAAGAKEYEIYIAEGSAPTYTRVGTTRGTRFVYDGPPQDQVTFKVRAVNADGVRSIGGPTSVQAS